MFDVNTSSSRSFVLRMLKLQINKMETGYAPGVTKN
jgi:hypothetical protein